MALLVLTPALAGCNVKDWYNQDGTVRIQMRALSGDDSLVDNFQSVKVALYGVTLRQRDAVNPEFFSFDEPKIVDLVSLAKEGEEVGISEFKTSLLPTVRVQLKIVVIEAIDAAGVSMEICRKEDTPTRFPCFYQPPGDDLLYEKNFAPPRGGTVIVHFPVAVKYAQQQRVAEYFLFADPALLELENKR